eukprot:6186349-Pleurochrysis_carterae.AAC.1
MLTRTKQHASAERTRTSLLRRERNATLRTSVTDTPSFTSCASIVSASHAHAPLHVSCALPMCAYERR